MAFIIQINDVFGNYVPEIYNDYMKNQVRQQIKILLLQEDLKLKELAEKLSEEFNKKYTPNSLSHKISRGSITFNEMADIAEILGYKITIEKK